MGANVDAMVDILVEAPARGYCSNAHGTQTRPWERANPNRRAPPQGWEMEK